MFKDNNQKSSGGVSSDDKSWDDNGLDDIKEKIKKLEEDENQVEDKSEDATEIKDGDSAFDELNDKYMRMCAEYENFRRRTLDERWKLINTWAIRILEVIIGFTDDFKRAGEQCPKDIWDSDFWKWIKLVEWNLKKELEKKWLKEMDILNKPFDPNKMESLMQDPNVENWIVAKIVEGGYEYGGEIARVAKVIVGSK